MTIPTEYTPGVCNIGTDEIRQRRRLGYAGAAFTIVAVAVMLAIGVAPFWFLLLFFPAFGTAIALVQSAARFCVHFGLAGLFNFGATGTTETVGAVAARQADRARAWQILRQAALYAAAATLAGVLAAAVI
ncbi:MAG: hypothetical protein KIT43_09865 [Bauldia sp.]|nr:hypothetical protein [Bauldia sp.]